MWPNCTAVADTTRTMSEHEPTPIERTISKKTEKDVPPADYYRQLYVLSRFVLNRTYDVQIEGEENILDEPAIYAANHVQFADSLLMSAIHTEHTGAPMRFVIKQEYVEGSGLNNKGKLGRSTKWFMEHTWQIPVDREAKDSGASAMRMVRLAQAALQRGESVGIHPGGTRIDESEGLPRFNDGVGLIALTSRKPLVPVSLQYGEAEGRFKKTPVIVKYGEPVMPVDFSTLPDPDIILSTEAAETREHERLTSKERVRRITSTAEARVAGLLNVARTGKKAVLKKHRDLEE